MSARDPQTGQFVSDSMADEPVLNDTWAVQARNINPGDPEPQEFVYPNILQNSGTDAISPPRGFSWVIHGIDYTVGITPEDSSGDNPSENYTALVELDEGDVPTLELRGGGNLTTVEFGNNTAGDAGMDVQSNRTEGPWLSDFLHGKAGMDNTVSGAGASESSDGLVNRMWRPPMPIHISDRVELDVHLSGVFPIGNASQNGGDQLLFESSHTVWYQEIEEEDYSRSIR
jgi:hypothetical protein